MTDSPLDAVGRLLAAAVPGDVPGLTAAVGRGPRTLGSWALGQAGTPSPCRVAPDTVFDLASLTKVVATTTLTLALAARGLIALEDQVVRHLPAAALLAEPRVTVAQLLTHTSGLPSSVQFYRRCVTREQLLRELYATPLEAPPSTRVAYSDLGFMLLGELAAAVTGEPLDALFARLVAEPLGLAATGYLPIPPAGTGSTAGAFSPDGPADPGRVTAGGPADPGRVTTGGPADPGLVTAGGPAGPGSASGGPVDTGLAASEFAATEPGPDGTPWAGVVHDENARVMDGVAGHAGLFSTAADLAAFAAWWASADDGAGPVPAALRREAERCQTPGLDGRRGLGWTRVGDRYDILGTAWPDSAVSHTGFTGTSLALDAASGAWVVLLTNEVRYGRDRGVIRPLRERVHAAAATALLRTEALP